MNVNAKIYVAGHRGLVGSAILRSLKSEGYHQLVTRTSQELNLTRQAEVESFFKTEKPDAVVIAAAKVGGILANRDFPAEFLYENIMIASNVIRAAAETNVKKLLFLGSSCIYPKLAQQPLVEESLLTGPLEETNEAYALAKIAGLKMTEYYNRQHGKNFISVMPPNMYGPGDNFHPSHSHVIPGLMRRFHEAKIAQAPQVLVWGSGTPLREFLYVDDLASGCVFLLKNYEDSKFVNLGSGKEISIAHLARLIARVVGYHGEILFDPSKPDGTPRKIMDHGKVHRMGWSPKVELEEGLKKTYQWYLENL